MEIPLTSFTDFVLKSGSPKMTSAKKIKNQLGEAYNPAGDYYKRFREAVQELHQNGMSDKNILKIVGDLPPNKVVNYETMADGYKKFLGRKEITYFKPIRKTWTHGNINIPINPELGLEWGGQKYLVKLYLKSDKPSKDKIASILSLMKNTLSLKKVEYIVLDVRNSKVYEYDSNMDLLLPLVRGEAESLEYILGKI